MECVDSLGQWRTQQQAGSEGQWAGESRKQWAPTIIRDG